MARLLLGYTASRLKLELEGISAQRAKHHKRLPVVLTPDEVRTLLAGVKGDAGLAVRLLYGCGLRVAEVLALRVKDVDAGGGKLEVRGGKGDVFDDEAASLARGLFS